jgi:hypothetical protein
MRACYYLHNLNKTSRLDISPFRNSHLKNSTMKAAILSTVFLSMATAFAPVQVPRKQPSSLFMAEEAEAKEAKLVSGEELEVMLTEWDQPLVLDAYATW